MASSHQSMTWKANENAAPTRCRSRGMIRTPSGNVLPSAIGTVVSEIDNLGRHLLEVCWENGICAYAFPHELEMIDDEADLICDDCSVDWAA